MKITQLRIKNLNSLKEEHTINFNKAPLSETGLFAITGPTGAGKSTLLDAISLALYNQIPRSGKLSTANIEKFGTLITRGTSDCFAEVEYQVNGSSYRSKWSISRNRNHNLRDYEMELSQLNQDGEWDILEQAKRNIPTKNTEITGLNYDQFVKSIVLSQGEFARFLKANANERSELLEKITGTEIYRQIGIAAYTKLREQKAKIEALNNKMQGIELLSPEDKESIIEKSKELKIELEKLEKQIKITKEQIDIRKQESALKLSLEKNRKDEEIIKKGIQDFAPRLQQLEQHNKLIHIKGDLQQNILLAKQIEQLKKQTGEWEKQITDKKKELEQISKQVAIHIENEKRLSTERKLLLPVLNKVSLLDEQLKNLTAQIKEHKNELDGSTLAYKNLEIKQNEHTKNLKTCENYKIEIEKFLSKNKALEEVPALLPLVNEQVKQMRNIFSKFEEEVKILQNKELKNHLLKGSNWTEKIEIIHKHIDDFKTQLLPLEEELKKAKFSNRDELKQLTEQAAQKIRCLDQLETLQKSYIKNNKEKLELELKLKANNKLIATGEDFLKKQEPKLKVLQLKEEEINLRIQRLQLESSLEDKREKLIPNEPCPLCGSTHHPFVGSYENKSKESKKEQEQLHADIKSITNNIDAQQKELVHLNADNKNIQERSDKLKITLNDDFQDFEKEQLKLKISLKILDEDSLKKLIEDFKNQDLQIKKLAIKYDSKENINLNLQLLKPIIDKATQIAETQKQSELHLSKLSEFIEEKSNLKSKLESLSTLHIQYQKKKEELSSQDKNIVQLNELIKAGIEKLEANRKEINQQTLKLNKFSKSKLDIDKKRKELLGDKLPAEEQIKIDNKLEQASLQSQESKKNELSAKNNIANLKNLLHKKTKNISELQNKYENEFKTLLALVRERSFDNLELAIKAILPEEIAESIKNKKDTYQNKKTANEQSKNDIEESLVKITEKISQLPTDELLKNEKLEDARLGEANKNLGAFEQQLKQDKENQKRAGNLLKELELQRKEVKRWDNLNDLIGDATGNKYSKFAQELSLQQMLSLANLHLRKLDKRYLLKYNPQQNEDLFVVDTLQGNEERSVRTLSGGESFIISLALALGLSDLAGQNTQLETLFIDEGFGSLDQVTLELALGTLERLQAESNRTIGIISHVEALKERISTQIELVKDNSGNSHIEIR
ncbi:AAA family ATPase [Marinifilum sp. RC60d5]|uniref:AAA family ATPase n=1 Tax=Marinifilum sp. RC60d5 TaxID=3458414 RepID=UPI00403575DF